MQIYFPLLPLDHRANFFWLCGFLKIFSKILPIKVDVEMFFPIVAPITPGDHKLNEIDSALYQEALV
jgi:hypothetical protein